ncbi:MAG TPA: bifunctional nuclease domain-containing protein [Baekduia sp.]|nr:bifunctional nuclease domain-containing protein [Baekduia sp.]
MLRPDDATLVARALARDAAGRAAFDVLVRRHHPMLTRTVTRALGGDEALAADAAQDAVLQALVGLPGLREPGAFGAWLTGIGLRVARRLGERARRADGLSERLNVLASGEPGPDEAAQRRATVARVREAVAALPPGQRDAVFLHYLAGLSRAEVAEHLGTGEGAIRTRLHKARATLREHLDDRSTPMTPTFTIADVRPTGDDRFSATHVVLLEEDGGAGRVLPIWVDTAEATALAAALEAVELPRPGTYAFAAALLTAAGGTISTVRIARLEGGVFYAVVELEGGASLDARPSDALNLALLTGAPIAVEEAVLAAADEPVPDGDGRGAPALAAALRERLAARG